MLSQLANTYSIVAYDPENNQFGVAVQSHYFCVGRDFCWAEVGVGAVATQAFVEVSYGPLGLTLMRGGKNADQALKGLLASDAQAEVRQVAMVDSEGNIATHTGQRCIAEAGHKQGKHYSMQANLMLKNTVWDAMAQAYENAKGELADRMLVALEAAEAEGGDIRGKQSAALLVVSGKPTPAPWQERLVDLRVDDNPEPLQELRRLRAIDRAHQYWLKSYKILKEENLDDEKFETAIGHFQEVMQVPEMAENIEVLFWHAASVASAGRLETALPLFKQVFEAEPQWREIVHRLDKGNRLPFNISLIEQILQET